MKSLAEVAASAPWQAPARGADVVAQSGRGRTEHTDGAPRTPGTPQAVEAARPPVRTVALICFPSKNEGPERRRDRGCCGGAASLCVGCACARDTSRRDDRRLGRGPRTARCRRAVRPWAVGVPCAGLFAAMGDPGAVAALRAELDAERAFSAQLAARVKAQVRRSRHEAHARALRRSWEFRASAGASWRRGHPSATIGAHRPLLCRTHRMLAPSARFQSTVLRMARAVRPHVQTELLPPR